jgi:magnesium transporter
MLFYSELIGKKVLSESHHLLGRLTDLIFLNEDNPRVTRAVVQSKVRHHEIPISALRTVNNHIEIKQGKAPDKRKPHELSVNKALLDQQIIDLIGNKVVRANDIVFQDVPFICVSGIDIGLTGILRRLGIESVLQQFHHLFRWNIPMQLLSWGDVLNLEQKYGQIMLKQHEERLANIHEEDLADYLEMTNVQNVDRFLKTVSTKKAADIIENLTINYQVELFQGFDPKKSADLISRIDPDEAVDILLALDRGKRDKITRELPQTKQEQLHRLMTFSRTPVGKLMTSEYCAVESHMTVRNILKYIRSETSDFSSLSAVYVLNRDDQLVGVFNPHELMMQDFETSAYKFMVPEPIVVLLTTPIEVVIYKFLKYRIPAIPVINREKKILGIITIDDVSGILLKKIQ